MVSAQNHYTEKVDVYRFQSSRFSLFVVMVSFYGKCIQERDRLLDYCLFKVCFMRKHF